MTNTILKLLSKFSLTTVLTIFASLFVAESALGATVYNCNKKGTQCVAKMKYGTVGDKVRVLNDKARVVAKGRVIKRKGAYAIISLTKIQKKVKRGYPVLVDINSDKSREEWAASFSYQGS